MTLIVTGSAGFLGLHVVDALRRGGHDVVGIDRRGHARLDADPRTSLRADLAAPDPRALAALRGADAVLHVAGCPGVRTDGPDAEARRWRDNVVAGRVVLDAVPADVPLVVVSSSSVYGGAHRSDDAVRRPSAEGDRLRPLGGYAGSKAALERACAARAAAGGRVLVVRPFTVVGQGQRADMALARWVEAALRGRALQVHGSPTRTRDLTDVGEVARALVALVRDAAAWPLPRADRAPTLNLGSGRPVALGHVVDVVRRVLDADVPIEVGDAHPHDPAHTWASTTLAERVVGALAAPDLETTVAVLAAQARRRSDERPLAGSSAHAAVAP